LRSFDLRAALAQPGRVEADEAISNASAMPAHFKVKLDF
jgi:hypothetical protein